LNQAQSGKTKSDSLKLFGTNVAHYRLRINFSFHLAETVSSFCLSKPIGYKTQHDEPLSKFD